MVPPSQISQDIKGHSLHNGLRKICLGGSYWAKNFNGPLNDMVNNSLFKQFLRYEYKNTFSLDISPVPSKWSNML